MEKQDNLELWWASLPVSEKERIATKASGQPVTYPGCTAWWNALEQKVKEKIHEHCVARHGDILREWDSANPYGD